jgi:hypothetical protein
MRSIEISTLILGCMVLGVGAHAQSAATVAAEKDRSREFGSTITAPMIQKYKAFLDSHPNIRRDFDQKYELAVDRSYINSHPDLRNFYSANKETEEAVKRHPREFMSELGITGATEGATISSGSLRAMRGYLAAHPQIAIDLRRDPGVGLSRSYLDSHRDFDSFLNSNKETFEEYKRHPKEMVDEAER